MKLHWGGSFDGDESILPVREIEPGATKFKEPDMRTFGIIANVFALVLLMVFAVLLHVRGVGLPTYTGENALVGMLYSFALLVAFFLSIPVHELLHAIWFKGDVSMYIWKSLGMFVTSTDDISKKRFIVMSLFPVCMLGIIPFLFVMMFPQFKLLGWFAVHSLSGGAGDFINIFNAATQVPRNGRIYMNGTKTYWYVPL